MARPVLIDEADGKCEICIASEQLNKANANPRRCHKCKEPVNSLHEMANNGYQSPRPDHFHLQPTLGLNGRAAIFAELCFKCYCEAYLAAYDKPYPPSIAEETAPILV